MLVLLALLAAMVLATSVIAAPVAVKALEGPAYGTLVLRGASDDKRLADGELIQHVRDGLVDSRLVFRFEDNSVYDETVVFSQERVFRLLSYSLVQTGPSFDGDIDVAFDRKSGGYRLRTRDDAEDEWETDEGEVEMPDDLYNGMAGLLMRNSGEKPIQAHLLAFTPEPRMLKSHITAAGSAAFAVGSETRSATRYRFAMEIGGVTGLLATAVGKTPPVVHYWIADSAPGFLRFEGAMYLDGPVWRIEPAAPRWLGDPGSVAVPARDP